MKRVFLSVAALLALGACTESPQQLQSHSRDTPAYAGTGSAYMQQDWKHGDKASWESHMKARSHYGQNDYTRMN